MSQVSAPAGGKSYANLAQKVSSPSPASAAAGPAANSSAWTTVGVGGKPKTPAAAQPPPPAPARAPSSGVLPAAAAPVVKKAPSRSSTLNVGGAPNAQDEFKKWAVGELRPDLNKGISGKFP